MLYRFAADRLVRPQAMRGVRPPAVAGLFYPEDRHELRSLVDRLLAQAEVPVDLPTPKAVIAPHAGYMYSGPIAANAMAPWRALAGQVERVVIAGPSHRVAFRGLALPAADRFVTPLGEVALDLDAAALLRDLPQVKIDAAPHAEEHGIEVELPFLQQVLGTFQLLPLVVGDASQHQVEAVLARLWGGPETLFVISSDLSHFLPYASAQQVDRQTVDQVVRLDGTLTPDQACGAYPINGFLPLAHKHRLQPRLLDLRNSGDTAGDRQRVVGYCAVAFAEN